MHVNSPCLTAKHSLLLCRCLNHGVFSITHVLLGWYCVILYPPPTSTTLIMYHPNSLFCYPSFFISSLPVDQPSETRVRIHEKSEVIIWSYACLQTLLYCLPGPVTISVLSKELSTILCERKHEADIWPRIKYLQPTLSRSTLTNRSA